MGSTMNTAIQCVAKNNGELEEITHEIHKELAAAQKSRLKIGQLLKRVRDEKIYQQKYDTIEQYIEDNFAKSRAWGYDLIGWANMGHLSTMVDNERQARELVGQPPAVAAAVVTSVLNDGGRLTAQRVREALAERLRRTQEEEAANRRDRPIAPAKKRDLAAARSQAESLVARLVKLCALFTDTGEDAVACFEAGMEHLRSSTDE